MAQPGNRMLDEFAKLMTDAAGVAQGARREAETVMRTQAERFMGQMDLVQRDEFEAVREMASKARLENEALRAEIDALKAQMSAPKKAKPAAKSVKKPAA
ncbi:accessory factor UbiK family protein [Rhizobiaceae bacterium]|nr:accessory factor UbiK family protein [Rhizobiaceae bacterium]